MYDILKLNKISPKIYDELKENYNCTDECGNPDGIIVRSFNMADYEVGSKLKAVARAGAGVNNIPIDKMTEKGVVVFNTPGANANAAKELVLAGMLLASRDIVSGTNWINTLSGDDVDKQAEKGKGKFAGTEILGKTLGVVGLGAIGVLVANMAIALGMKVIAYEPYLSKQNEEKLNKEVTLASFEEVAKGCDILTVHVPLLDSTKKMINASVIASMKKGAVILNMSRAPLVDLDAVKAALKDGQLRKYVVDFPTQPALNTEGILVLPHLGASTEEAEDNCAVMAAAQLKDFLENKNIKNSVNFPNLIGKACAAYRYGVFYKVESGAVAALEATGASVEKAERGAYGYAIVATDKALELKGFDGVIRVF